ncbi:MAG: tRNA pseudouridine(55) synthase TruB [Saccharofermentans sp.]|nr:tRNA pseudouridine(55) synthase TruB [Saccharofermentans sp.]
MIPDGIILLDKKPGITSMASDNFIKKVAGTRKVGHSGTLDPFATGLLPIFTGRALKVMRYTDGYDKAYRCTAVFGTRMSTMDKDGEAIATYMLEGSQEEKSKILDAFEQIKTIKEQIPPSFSAKKINGQKAYDLARQGIEVELKPHKVTINNLTIHSIDFIDGSFEVDFEVDCSKGTYIRTICDDVGEATGFHAYAKTLRRTKAGPFNITNGYTEEQIKEMADREDYSFVIPAEECLKGMPSIELNKKQFDDVRLGRKISAKNYLDIEEGLRFASYFEGRLTAIQYREGDILRIERMLAVD